MIIKIIRLYRAMKKLNPVSLIRDMTETAYEDCLDRILNNSLERIVLMDNAEKTFSDWLPDRSTDNSNDCLTSTNINLSRNFLSARADDDDRTRLYKMIVDAVDEISCTSKDLVLSYNNEYLTLYRI